MLHAHELVAEFHLPGHGGLAVDDAHEHLRCLDAARHVAEVHGGNAAGRRAEEPVVAKTGDARRTVRGKAAEALGDRMDGAGGDGVGGTGYEIGSRSSFRCSGELVIEQAQGTLVAGFHGEVALAVEALVEADAACLQTRDEAVRASAAGGAVLAGHA